ncbi:MAG: FG-GAP-like repeat-containing protein, partial [Myxococcota bacterium]|nr:FG-GAP-like repeat-containing protein [Myxococcota bacterium]
MALHTHICRALLIALVGFFSAQRQVRATCNVSSSATLTENFSKTTNYDPDNSSVSGWSSSSGQVSLNGRGGEFSLALGENYTGVIYAMTGGDYNLDSRCLDDFVMLSRNASGACKLLFGRNKGGTTHEGFEVSSTTLASLDSAICDRNAAPVLLTGRLNNDSFPDVVLMYTSDAQGAGSLSTKVFINDANAGSGQSSGTCSSDLGDSAFKQPPEPTFSAQSDSLTYPSSVYTHWASDYAVLKDWDGDGYDDILVLSGSNTVNLLKLFITKISSGAFNGVESGQTVISDVDVYTPIANGSNDATSLDGACISADSSGSYSRGPSLLLTGDFDGDGDNDIIVGSVSQAGLKYFRNDGGLMGPFVQQADIAFSVGGAAHGAVADFDLDGDLDFVVMRDDENCYGGTTTNNIYLFRNQGGGDSFAQEILYTGLGDTNHMLSGHLYQADGSGAIDVYMGINSGYSVLLKNGLQSKVANKVGVAQSTNILAAVKETFGVVSMTISSFTRKTPVGTSVALYLTNNGGRSWEEVSAVGLYSLPYTHAFKSHGMDLRFKVVLRTTDGKVTPTVYDIAGTYQYTGAFQYSRSKLTTGTVTVNKKSTELLFEASYTYPDYVGSLKAYDLSGMPVGASINSLNSINSKGVLKATWDA